MSQNNKRGLFVWPQLTNCVVVVQAMCIPEGSMVTMDFRTDRVRVFVDGQGKVAQAPHRG